MKFLNRRIEVSRYDLLLSLICDDDDVEPLEHAEDVIAGNMKRDLLKCRESNCFGCEMQG